MTDQNAPSGDPGASENDPAHGLASRFPTAYTILFLLIIFVAALTWIIPAGQYDRVMNEEIGREVAVAGTFKTVEANPQGFVEVMLAPVAGFYDPDSYEANAIDVALFVLFLGGFLGVVNATGAIDAGIKTAMIAMKGREIWMIPNQEVWFPIRPRQWPGQSHPGHMVLFHRFDPKQMFRHLVKGPDQDHLTGLHRTTLP